MELTEFVLQHRAEEVPKDFSKEIYEVDQLGIIRYAIIPMSGAHGNPEEDWHFQ